MSSYSGLFKRLINCCEPLPLARTVKNEIISEIEFFNQMAIAENELISRRPILRERWAKFKSKATQLGLFEKLHSTPDLWASLDEFFSCDVQRLTLNTKFTLKDKEILPDKPIEAEEFFSLLRHKTNKVTVQSELEETILRVGLSHLRAEAKLPRAHRSAKEIQETWSYVKRLIVRYKLSDSFKGNDDLKSKLRFFLFGRF